MTATAGSRRGGRRGTRQRFNRREALAGYLFIAPWIIGFCVFTLGTMANSLVISFTDFNLAAGSAEYVGTDNYARLLEDPLVRRSLGNTLFFAVLAVPLEIAFALLLALLLHHVRRGAGVFRTLYYLPKMTPAVATASVFILLLNGNRGAINAGLRAVGLPAPQWLVDPTWVKPAIVIMTLWGVSGTMVIFLAALKQVPRELYEVAALDGAGPVRRFFAVTVPMISGALLFNVVVLTIAAFQVFDQAYLLFARDQASPDQALFYAVYLFQRAFRDFDFGFAAAMAWLLFFILVLLTFVQIRVGNRYVHYEGERS